MKIFLRLILLVFASIILLSQPYTITYQGKLLDNNGIPINQSNVAMTFAIYNASSGGIKIWPSATAAQKTVDVVNGLYSVTLGTGSGNDDVFITSTFDGVTAYLEVEVNSTTLPRTLISSVPTSIFSNSLSSVAWASPSAIGSTTPNSGAFNSLTIGTGATDYTFPATRGTVGQIMQTNGSGILDWVNTTQEPSGPAGGDLSGTYPNPTIGSGVLSNGNVSASAAIDYSKLNLSNSIQNSDILANAITTSKVANGTVTTSKMADSAISGLKLLTYAVNTRHISDGAITLPKISSSGASSGQVIQFNGSNIVWGDVNGGTVSINSTLLGDGSSGNLLRLNLGNSNTWSQNQTFGGTFLITANSRIAMTNSDNNARDIRFQEPSGTGSQFIGLRAPSVTNNGNYVFPAVMGTVGQVLTIQNSNSIDSASLHWTTPSSGGSSKQYFVKSTNTERTDQTTISDDPHLSVSLSANKTYFIRISLVSVRKDASNGKLRNGIRYSGQAISHYCSLTDFQPDANDGSGISWNNSVVQDDISFTNSVTSTVSPDDFEVMITTTTAGTFAYQWGNRDADGFGIRMLKGSFMIVEEMP